DQGFEDLLAFGMLGVDGDRALVPVEHREVEAVYSRDVAQLAARDIPLAGSFHLDDVGSEPRQQLRAGWTGLNVREIEDANPVQCLAHRCAPLKTNGVTSCEPCFAG